MKTTLEIPDGVFRKAKAAAAERGIPLREFVTQAVRDKLAANGNGQPPSWLRHAGKLRHLRHETARLFRDIEDMTERIDPEMWR